MGNDCALTPRCDLATQSGQTAQSKTEKRGMRIYLDFIWSEIVLSVYMQVRVRNILPKIR